MKTILFALLAALPAFAETKARNAQIQNAPVNVCDRIGATCPSGGDDSAAIQAAVNAACGKTLLLPKGTFNTSSTITINCTIDVIGSGSSFGDSTNVSRILYSGTGPAVLVDPGATNIYNVSLSNFRIEATGSATSSASAIGLKLINSNYGYVRNLVVRGFGGGVGILATASTGQIGASNTFVANFLWSNLVGYKFDGFDATHGDFASVILSGAVIGANAATVGSKGLYVTQYAAETTVYGTDFETHEYPIDLDGNGSTNGGGVRLIGTRSEFQGQKHIRINATADRTTILGHRFVGGAVSSQLSDSGSKTFRLDRDAGVFMNDTGLYMLNNIPISMRDSGGTDRSVLKLASNDTVQVGTSVGNGNFPQGVWFFQSTSNVGSITLSTGSGTATVGSGTKCVCTDTTANASVKCAVAATTLTATGTGSDVIAYHCF